MKVNFEEMNFPQPVNRYYVQLLWSKRNHACLRRILKKRRFSSLNSLENQLSDFEYTLLIIKNGDPIRLLVRLGELSEKDLNIVALSAYEEAAETFDQFYRHKFIAYAQTMGRRKRNYQVLAVQLAQYAQFGDTLRLNEWLQEILATHKKAVNLKQALRLRLGKYF